MLNTLSNQTRRALLLSVASAVLCCTPLALTQAHAATSVSTETAYVSKINSFTSKDFLRGIWRQYAGLSVPATQASIDAFKPGVHLRFADGQLREISKVFRVGSNLSIYVKGGLLDGNKVGSPNTVSTVPAPRSGSAPPATADTSTTITQANPAFMARGDIKGIDITPPVNDWEAPAYGMTQTRLTALSAAGFNTLRVWISLEEFLAPPVSMEATLSRWIGYIDRAAQTGFRVQVAWASTWEERIAVVNDPASRVRFHDALNTLCSAMGSYFPKQQVALEMLNEPPGEHLTPGYYRSAAPGWHSACRSKAPDMTIILQPEAGWHGALNRFNLSDFDANTMFSFHPYAPGEFTHQGIGSQPHLYNVPMPITRYVGGQTQMVADVSARVNADPHLSSERKKSEIARYSRLINDLWYDNGSRWEDWSELQRWVVSSGTNPKRIIAGEFGVVSEFNYNGTPALKDVASRAHFMRKIREQTQANQFAGWVVHQAFGDFNLFQQNSVGEHGDRLIPELTEALFGSQPLQLGPPVTGH
ncbi:cellulase family glycosylhydrolase [Stutzerimonas xanthomarina]|uniref:Cellulase (Glycosyl hydrolase family 5) n=4 Tax=Stutzerimonas xanthomarina TaxID=271420 RepID=A0A1M5K9W6_9GAMM|nr:cellulase family glycosylhydrolase [Stutzerimonas xanthomarina]SEI05069.1 Cellulase (glycosyl hydrolase family 5) [Stutzerimonas xanthomarina]SHG48973.1 Cellulase (glycosyl hydrolase family 5) [Stutzerimonas xanthomarina DSM 18231]